MKQSNLEISRSTASAICKHECPAVNSELCRNYCPILNSPARMRQKNWHVISRDPDAPTFFSAVREG